MEKIQERRLGNMRLFTRNSVKAALLVLGLLTLFISVSVAQNLPEFYGMYIKQGEKIIPLKLGDLVFKTAFSLAGIRSGMYGIPALPDARFDNAPIEIIFYNQRISPEQVYLTTLVKAESIQANYFDLKKSKTNPAFFRNLYGVGYNTLIPINLWVVSVYIPLQIAPVPERLGMYKLVPAQTLAPGVYAVTFGSVGGAQYYLGNDLAFYPFVIGNFQEK